MPGTTPMKSALVLLVSLSFLFPSTLRAADEYPKNEVGERIYVDSIKGNDAEDGRSAATAVKTLLRAQRLMDELPVEGWVTLMMARGSVWRESYSPKTFWEPSHRDLFLSRPPLVAELQSSGPPLKGRPSPYAFGRDRLNLIAYGEGEAPTINGTDVLDKSKLQRHDPGRYPNVWSQVVRPPVSYYIPVFKDITYRPGVIIDQKVPLWRVYTPLPIKTRDYPDKQPGIETEDDALKMVNSTTASFYVRDNKDGSFVYFINSGLDPSKDSRLYEYKVRGSHFSAKRGVRWEGIRFYGLNHRDGVSGTPMSLTNVEFIFGDTHNMLIGEGHFRNVTSNGYLPDAPAGQKPNHVNGDTVTAFHTFSRSSLGLLYDGCIGKNAFQAFYDHEPEANRQVVIVRNSVTENIAELFSHRSSTRTSYIIGHRHSGKDGTAFGGMGALAAEANLVEDSIFRFAARGGWQADTKHLKVRNSVFYMKAGQTPLFFWGSENFDYENVTFILDYQGQDAKSAPQLVEYAGKQPSNPATVTFKNCVIAVINAPNVSQANDKRSLDTRFGNLAKVTFQNCVLTYMSGLPPSAGQKDVDFVFATPEEIFSRNPTKGDYTINPSGPAGKRDAGCKSGRTPVFGAEADKAAEAFVFKRRGF